MSSPFTKHCPCLGEVSTPGSSRLLRCFAALLCLTGCCRSGFPMGFRRSQAGLVMWCWCARMSIGMARIEVATLNSTHLQKEFGSIPFCRESHVVLLVDIPFLGLICHQHPKFWAVNIQPLPFGDILHLKVAEDPSKTLVVA